MTSSRMSSRAILVVAFALVIRALVFDNVWSTSAQKAAPTSSQQRPSSDGATAVTPSDYSHEAVVIEHLKMGYRFERNGTGQRELSMRARVQSEAGLERFGQLIFPYSSANESLNVDYVRVRKPDGSQVTASPTDVQDLSAPLAREAPIYTDLRQKHVTVPGLRPGDTLEYHVVWTVHTSLAENHFWLEHNFITRDLIVLRDELEVNIPVSSNAKLKLEPGYEPVIKDEQDRRTYSWKRSNLKSEEKEDDDETADEEKGPQEPRPHVQLTTFQSWDEVGKWYAALQQDRVVPDERIRSKAEEVVRGRSSDKDKVQALYEYVAKNFRYVSLSFGQGRYQPHGATEVLANEYGDCKDKHTLFAAMLAASGLQAFPVLINSVRKIDADVPSPAQFDHVITAIPLGDETLWADTTPEVAPFRLLAPPLRNKQALLIPTKDVARLETTPAEPPFVSSETVTIEGEINDIGQLSLHLKLVLRGDSEMYFRMMFRRTPKSRWKDLGYVLAGALRARGTVTEIKASDPSDLDKPFEVEYDLTTDSFLNWSSKKLKLELPLPSVNLRSHFPARKSTKPIELGAPSDFTYSLKLKLPARYQARLPVPLSVSRDYAEYKSSYQLEGNTVIAERRFRLRRYEIAADRSQDYQAFVAAARSDEAQSLALESETAGSPEIPESVKIEDLRAAAQTAIESENFSAAEPLLKRIVEKDPKDKAVRRSLAFVLSLQQKFEEAIPVLKEQTEINPFDDYAYGLLGRIYWRQQDYALAENAFRKQLEISPLDKVVQGNLGQMLVQWRKYREAIPELEKAISLEPEGEMLRVSLGRAYLGVGETKKGIAAFDEAVKMRPGASVWNDVAYFLAVNNVNLDQAQQYAESAVTTTSTNLRNLDLQNLTLADLTATASLAAYWDTLGWVYFQKGEMDIAEKYIAAAWLVGQHSEVGYHLGMIAEKRGDKHLALRLYAHAAAAHRLVPEATESLARLAGKEKAQVLTGQAIGELINARSLELGELLTDVKEKTEAEFYVAFAPDASRTAHVVDVKFISGAEKLKDLAAQLKTLRYGLIFPGDLPTKVIRRGRVSCGPKPTKCSFAMIHPDSITSLH